MSFSVTLQVAITAILIVHPNIYCHCQPQFFNPLNYLDQLPSLKMPYVNNIPIPNIPLAHIIKPTPALTTKVINVVTKYISRNPVCIKSSGRKKPACKKDAGNANEHIITKEYFVNNRVSKQEEQRGQMEEAQRDQLRRQIDSYKQQAEIATRAGNINKMLLAPIPAIDGSEPVHVQTTDATRFHRIARAAPPEIENEEVNEATPELHARKLIKGNAATTADKAQLKDLLIEDRLDRLEDMLPHYTRMRIYQTSTITVTRTRTARMATATLMVKNCVPDGIDYCKKSSKSANRKGGNKKKRRKSKVAVLQSQSLLAPNYSSYYYG